MPLTDAKLRSLKPAGKPQKIADSGGLHILVTPGGSRLWRLAYRFGGKQKLLALGKYPDVSLANARLAREVARKQLEDGQDPSEVRKAEKRRTKIAAGQTFAAVADEWFDSQKDRWVASYSDRLRRRLDDDLIARLGKRPIAEIEPIEVLDVVRAIERRDAVEMGRRVLQMASAVFRYGVATSRCPRDPTADLRGALRAREPVKRRSALAADALPDFLKRLAAYDGDASTRLALEFALLTFVRTAELRFARWSEFEDLDGDEPLWRIPAERMKMRRAHLVPLSSMAVDVLCRLKQLGGKSELVLPADTRSGVISENTMLYALYRLGYHGRATVHGFRSTASTILNENHFNRDWIEMQLAHADGSVRAVYNAAEWLPGRRTMMDWWAEYLAAAREHAGSVDADGAGGARDGRPQWK
jgi:integrase